MNDTQTPETKYYADYDDENGLYCVFNENGKALSSWSSMEQAKDDAAMKNLFTATRAAIKKDVRSLERRKR